jgi:hypothetical protein
MARLNLPNSNYVRQLERASVEYIRVLKQS